MSARAELVADRGAAVAGREFFRSAEFMASEGVTHTLVIEGPRVELSVPLIVRPIEGEEIHDAASPYGYPGALSSGSTPLEPAQIDWRGCGLVSVFIRHRVDEPPPLGGASERNRVYLFDPQQPRKSRMSDRQQIRRNLRRGYEVECVPGPAASQEKLAGFAAAYSQTMNRAGASDRYFFSAEYLAGILAFPQSWLILAHAPGGETAAGSILTRSDGMLHYFLSGTLDERLRESPMKNIVWRASELAEELEVPLNLGGGLKPGDRLEEFKRGFANTCRPWHTSELICEPETYERLAAGAGGGDFFPAYRAARS